MPELRDHDRRFCAPDSYGSLLCWGNNTFGQLANGGFDSAWLPTPVLGL